MGKTTPSAVLAIRNGAQCAPYAEVAFFEFIKVAIFY
jgi:hypothetical protein